LSLPLLDDVGWAAIDYVRGRPSLTACPKVFVKHRCLFGTFGALRGAPPGWHGPRRA
jgi:hypothetical protein